MSVLTKFLRYVQIDTQSDPTSTTYPSTAKQKDLGHLLVQELHTMGIENAHTDQYGYVYATLPSNDPDYSGPTIGLCSHMDTSPDASGTDVKPIVHDYQGGDITLPGDSSQVITITDNPLLADKIGEQIVTSDGTTLLGADDKAGIAEIMTALEYLISHPEIQHGDIKVCFTPDEEVGTGTKYIDLETFNPDFAYTIDGGALGSLDYENFNADTITLRFVGYNVHPGYAKDKMINANRVASHFVSLLPRDHSPETTANKEPYINVSKLHGDIGETTVSLMLRSFDLETLDTYEQQIKTLAQQACDEFPGSSFELERIARYRNMAQYITPHPEIIDRALAAMKSLSIDPIIKPIRGGTDGAHLSEVGIPCPNLFAGGHNFHSVKEWVSVQDMEKAVTVIVGIVRT